MTLVNRATSQFKDLYSEATTIGLGVNESYDESILVTDTELDLRAKDTICDKKVIRGIWVIS